MSTEKTASITIPIKAESNAKEATTDLEALRAKIVSSQDAVKEYGAAMRSLRGSTDEVKKARADLKDKLTAERDALSRANVAIVKQGTTYERLAKQERGAAKAAKELGEKLAQQQHNAAKAVKDLEEKLAKQQHAAAKAVKELGGPVQAIRDKFESLKTVMDGATTAADKMTIVFSALAAGAAIVVVAVLAIAAAAIAAGVAFSKFVIEGANWNRTANLMRQAASGSTQNASALGHQVDALAGKVATSKQELNELALSMTRSLLGTRVSGEGLVDTFNAVGQAAAAMGDEAGSKIQEIIERSKQFGRMSLGRFELQGTGISFEDVAGNLSKQLKIGLDDARLQLLAGWVDINAGAKAIRTAVEQKFARINLAKMLDFDVIKKKLGEFLTALTENVNLEPLLNAFQSLTKLFDQSTVTGAALKDIVTDFGNALGISAKNGADAFKGALEQLIIWALKLDIQFLQSKKTLLDFLSPFGSFPSIKTILLIITGLVVGLTAAFVALAFATIEFWGPIALIAAAFAAAFAVGYEFGDWLASIDWSALGSAIAQPFVDAWNWLKGIDWGGIGKSIIDGIVGGLRAAWDGLTHFVGKIADSVKDTFKNLLGIHSPSQVFKDFGFQTVAGFAQGIDESQGDATAAINAMAPRVGPSAGDSSGPSGRSGPAQVIVNIHVAGHDGAEVARALSAPDFLSSLTKAIEDACTGSGVPIVQAASA